MRLHEVERGVDDWAEFFAQAHAMGVDTLHSSTEYDSFPLFAEVLARLREMHPEIRFRHVVKLADPHFGEAGFDRARLGVRVKEYLDRLGIDQVDDVQWLWRNALDDDATRVSDFRAAASGIGTAVADLKREGLVGRLLCFPYSPAFAQEAVATAAIDGLVVYRNVDETEYDPAIHACAAAGKPCLIIRPFLAGKVIERRSPGQLLAFALDKPAIEAAILSTSSLDHLADLIGAAA